MLVKSQIYSAQPKWVNQCEKHKRCWEQSPSSVERRRFPRSATLCCPVLLFFHSGVDVISCDMRKHVRCPSWPDPSSAASPPLYPPPPNHPDHPLPCILCVYEHQNAIRPSQTPLVPALVGPTVAVHSQPSGRWLVLTTGPLLQPLWKITPKKSLSWGKILGSVRRIEQLGKHNNVASGDSRTSQLLKAAEGRWRRGRVGGRVGWGSVASANGVMSYETPEWQLVNWEGLADQRKSINCRKWISPAGPEMAVSNEAQCKWRRKRVVKTL